MRVSDWLKLFLVILLCIDLVSCSKQQTNGTVYIHGLKGPVYVNRDQYGIPHILALKSDDDAYLALGFVQAQDRFWQMEYQRRIASGRLSEIFGDATIKEDKFLRNWGFYRATVAEWPYLSQQTQTTINSYTTGINAFIALDDFPLQVKLLRYTPESWSNYDSLTVQKTMAFNLQNNWMAKLDNLAIAESYGESKVLQFKPSYPATGPTILSDRDLKPVLLATQTESYADENVPINQQIKFTLEEAQQISKKLGFEPFSGKGSNSWVVSGSMTKSGKPLLANDPHLGTSAPTLWYMADIIGPTLHVTGATIPGLPMVIIGHNQHIAWGLSASYSDTQDLFIIPPKAKTRTINELIKVKESDPINYKVLISTHGPIITSSAAVESIVHSRRVAIQWPVLDSDDTTIQSMLQIQKATNWQEFTNSLRDFVGPSQNFIYADTAGNIGYFLPGRLPIRKNFSGKFPVSESTNWSGYIPFEELPQTYNPPEGFIVTANNKIVSSSYKYPLAYRFGVPPYRAQRIIDLITHSGKVDKMQFQQFQQDSISYLWRDLAPILTKAHAIDPSSEEALAILNRWDGNCALDSIGATVFAYWLQQFNSLVPYKSAFGADTLPTYPYLKAVLSSPAKAKFLSESLSKAMLKLHQEHGSNQQNWQWGKLHYAYFSELGLGQSQLIGWLWERKIATSGGYDTVNVGSYNSKTFKQFHAATYRQVIDLASLDDSSYIMPLGQSENVFSNNYADLLTKWAHGEYIAIKTFDTPCNPTQPGCMLLLPKD